MSPILVNPSRFGTAIPATPSAFVASATGVGNVTTPAGATNGDWLVIIVSSSASQTAQASNFPVCIEYNRTGNGIIFFTVLSRRIDGTEPASWTLAGTTISWSAALYRGGVGFPAIIAECNPTPGSLTSLSSRFRAPVDGTVVHVYASASSTGASPTVSTPTGTTSRASNAGQYFTTRICEETSTPSAGTDGQRLSTLANTTAACSFAIIFPTSTTIPYPALMSVGGANSANASIVLPSALQVGDLIIAAFQVTAASISAGPSGFTAFDSGQATGGSYSCNYWWGYKVAASGDAGATKSCTSGGQVWASACLVLHHPGSTTLTVGTKKTGHGDPGSFNAQAAGSAAIGLHAWMVSANASSPDPAVDQTTAPGLDWLPSAAVASNYGRVAIGIEAVPSGDSTLTPSIPSTGSGSTWVASTALLNVA